MAGQEVNGGRTWASRRARRLAPIAGMAVALLVVLAGCGGMEIVPGQPYSHISPANEKTDDIQDLYRLIFWAGLVVFILVQFAIVYAALKFRRRGDERPAQVHGNRTAEIAWTVIPAVLLLIVFIPTARTIYDQAAAVETADFEIDVYG